MASVIRIKPLHYIHVLDNNKNVTRVEIGPQTFTRQDHEKVVEGPSAMIIIPPRKYCIIDNPVEVNDDGSVMLDKDGNAVLRHGDQQIRFHRPPFALYPGERLNGRVSPLQVVAPNTALRLKCLRNYEDGEGEDAVKRTAGEEWLWVGPGTYMPNVAVQVVEIIRATLVQPNEALRIRAIREFVDRDGNRRDAGEEWLFRTPGAYLPEVHEQIVATVRAVILTDTKALSLRATRTFTDEKGTLRKAGSEWLVTNRDFECHIPDVFEEVIGEVRITSLNDRQYCVVMDPVDPKTGAPQLGNKELRKGPSSFFLLPGERLESGIQNVKVLGAEEALLLCAREAFTDADEGEERAPGDRWMIYGPRDYVTPVEVEVLETRRSIALDDNEGVYVRDVTTGKVASVIGRTYMLKPHEEPWEKHLPANVEELVKRYSDGRGEARDPTRVVSLRAPHNTAVQIYDYKEKKARVVFGPDMIMLGPDEHFTLLSLSGDTPKRPHVVKDLCLRLGPEFSTDVVTVETADHARLSLKLSYNWHFDVSRDSDASADAGKIFVVPDFVGDFCKAIASRVRGAVARTSFDKFHKESAKIIRTAVFGLNEAGKVKNKFVFTANNLTITNIDIQSVEPVDQRTRDSLQKSVQLAIEITTKSQEATARHLAQTEEQEARGRLERQKISDEAEAEKARKELLTLQTQSATVETTGQATAEAKARAAAAQIEGEASVKLSELRASSLQIKSDVELECKALAQSLEINHKKLIDDIEMRRERQLAEVEAGKFRSIVKSIGAETIESISQAGPEMQAKLLGGLGLQSFLITDGSSPINLFNTAEGLIAGPVGPSLD